MALSLGLVMGCSGPIAQTPDPALAAAPFPSVYSVPPPPSSTTRSSSASNSVTRCFRSRNARYQRDETRHELGLASAAPSPTPPAHVAEPAPNPGSIPVVTPSATPEPIPGGGQLAALSSRRCWPTQRWPALDLPAHPRAPAPARQTDRGGGLVDPSGRSEDFSGRPLSSPLATLVAARSVDPPPDAQPALARGGRRRHSRTTGHSRWWPRELENPGSTACPQCGDGADEAWPFPGYGNLRGIVPGNQASVHIVPPDAG